jgi:hypothetical protein
VALADIHILSQQNGSYCGTTDFLIEPAGVPFCTLQLPATCQLIHVWLNDVSAPLVDSSAATTTAPQRWRLAVGASQLPQILRVVYTGQLPAGRQASAPYAFQTPRLARLPVERTLWTVYPAERLGVRSARDIAQPAGSLESELVRLETLASLLQMPPEVLSDRSPEELRPWYIRLARSLRAAQARAVYFEQFSGGPGAADALDERLEPLWRQWEGLLGNGDLTAQIQRDARQHSAPAQLLAAASPAARRNHRGAAVQVTASPSATRDGDLPARLLASLLAVAMAVLVFVPARLAWLGDALEAHPHVLGVLAGLAWWLWLAPSFMGWIILLASLLAGFWSLSPWGAEPVRGREAKLRLVSSR